MSKADLLARAWPDAIVEEGNLTVQIAALRKALGQADDGQDWILTVPRVGYRLVAAGGSEAADGRARDPAARGAALCHLGGEPGQEWFADGIVDDVITALGRFRSFAVVARSSSFVYKGRRRRRAPGRARARRALPARGQRPARRRPAADHRPARRRRDRQAALGRALRRRAGRRLRASRTGSPPTVAMSVEPAVEAAEIERSRRERPGSAAAYDVYLQAVTKTTRTAEENAEAYAQLTGALGAGARQPAAARPRRLRVGASACHGLASARARRPARCTDLARRACSAPRRPDGAGPLRAASAPGREGVRPGDGGPRVGGDGQSRTTSWWCSRAGIAHLHCGDLEQALGLLSPGDPARARATRSGMSALTGIAHAHMVLGNYAAARAGRRSLAVNTTFDCTYWMLVAANAHLGRMDEARRHLAELRRLAPGGDGREHPRRPVRQGPRPDRADPHRTAAGRAAGGIAFARVPSSGADRFSQRFGSFHRPLKDMKRHGARPSS